jgi:hypothetical protein
MMSNERVLLGKFYFSDKTKRFLFGLLRPCGKSKPVTHVQVNGMADSDEDVFLNQQLKENDIF